MNSSRLSNSGSSPRMLEAMGCGYLTSLIRLLVLGVQLESWLVTSILAALTCGSEF
jgi:hypothetical protein